MDWIFFSTLAAVFFSISVIIDKILLTKYFEDVSVTTLTATAGLAGIPFLAAIFLVGSINIDAKSLFVGIGAGFLIISAYQIYYSALKNSDVGMISVLFQLILPINLFIGTVVFGERPTGIQIAGLFLMILATGLISFEERESKWRLNWRIILIMLLASTFAASSDAVYRYASDELSFWSVAFSEYFGTVIFGLILFGFSSNIRKEMSTLRKNLKQVTTSVGVNELVTLSGTLSLRYALFIGPLALIQGIIAAQPLITIVLVMLFSLIGLKINDGPAKKHRWHVQQQVITSSLVIIAAIMITSSS